MMRRDWYFQNIIFFITKDSSYAWILFFISTIFIKICNITKYNEKLIIAIIFKTRFIIINIR